LLLLLPFYFLEFFKTNFIEEQTNLVLVLALTFFLFFEKDPAITLPFGSKAFYFLVADGCFLLIKPTLLPRLK
jgi:hypothetical protein